VLPEPTVTLAGTISAELLLESATTTLPTAAVFNVTEQFDVAPPAMVDGLQLNKVTCAGAVTVTVVCADPL
jgi:hypothetical protein